MDQLVNAFEQLAITLKSFNKTTTTKKRSEHHFCSTTKSENKLHEKYQTKYRITQIRLKQLLDAELDNYMHPYITDN